MSDSSLKDKFKVAINVDFLTAFSKLPQAQQQKTWRFVEKFKQAPNSPGINYETIRNVRDQNLRSVRVGDDYRAIVLKPEQGDVYILLWVDHHDEAYRWAERKTCRINPESGALQIIDCEAITEQESTPPPAAGQKPLFDHVKDKHLLRFGLPVELIPLLRKITNDSELDQFLRTPELPQEAAEALFMLAAGYTLDELYLELEKTVEPITRVDTTDFAAALENIDSQRRFYVLEDERELAAMLNAPLEQWRVFLHPSQRKIVERKFNGPARVLGGAGTGKTVVAMHRAKWLAEKVFTQPNDRILFTTFTVNLAADIKANLANICSPETMQKIEVINLDKWVSDFLARYGYNYRLMYDDERAEEFWQKAIVAAPQEPVLDLAFYREEWQKVIQAQGVTSLDDYLKASRIGRGTALTRKDRIAIWPVFDEYRSLLNDGGFKEIDDAMRDARKFLETKGNILPYRAVIVDEGQDMAMEAFRLIRQLVPAGDNDIFIVGDAHQRIYGKKTALSTCGIDIRGRSRKLRINYRTTDETRRWAVGLLEGVSVDDLNGEADSLKGYRSLMHGENPTVETFSRFEDEIDFVVRKIKHLTEENGGAKLGSICLVARTEQLLSRYEKALNDRKIETYTIKRSVPDESRVPGLRLATMHRVKGLQFNHVFLSGVDDGIVPLDTVLRRASDETARRELEQQERRLMHVAATRAKKSLFVTAHSRPSPFLKPLMCAAAAQSASAT